MLALDTPPSRAPPSIPRVALILVSESPFDEVLFPVCTLLLTRLFFPQLQEENQNPPTDSTTELSITPSSVGVAVGLVGALLQAQPWLKLKALQGTCLVVQWLRLWA